MLILRGLIVRVGSYYVRMRSYPGWAYTQGWTHTQGWAYTQEWGHIRQTYALYNPPTIAATP